MSFKDNFIKLCAEKGLSPTKVCIAIGISGSNFSNWDEYTVPRRATLVKLADYLGCSTDRLVLGDDDKNVTYGDISKLEYFIDLHAITETRVITAESLNDDLKKGYRILGQQQYRDNDGLIKIQFVVGK